MFNGEDTDIIHPYQAINLTIAGSPDICLPKTGPLIDPAATFGQFISRLNPSQYVLLVLIEPRLLRLKTLE